jgi:GMP synthase-like glutamine amidotransferase
MAVKVKKERVLGYCPQGQMRGDIEPFQKLFTHKKCVEDGMEGIDCLILWGGCDIHPSYYGQKKHPYNGAPDYGPSARDVFEWKAMLYCKMHDIPMIGICRGAQFLTAFNGGKLVQHVTGHGYEHPISTSRGDELWSNSVHHQMMYPFDTKHEMLAWTKIARSHQYEGEDKNDLITMPGGVEPEIVYYPDIRGLAIQGHPEYGNATHGFKALCVQLASEFLFNEKVLA